MSRRKNILLLALLLLASIAAIVYFNTDNRGDIAVEHEIAKPDSLEIQPPKPDSIAVTKPVVVKPTDKPTLRRKTKISKQEVKLETKSFEKIEKIDIGSIGEKIESSTEEISTIGKSNLIFEPIDLPDVVHYVYLEYQRVEPSALFVPKGQWLFGGTMQYTNHTNSDYKLLMIEDWEGKGYNVGASVYVGYAVKDNMALGVKASYGRTLLNIDNLNLNLGDDLNFSIDHAHYLNQQWSGTFFMRNFFSLFRSRQFGLFNDTEITLSGGRGKMINGSGEALKGTYESFFKASVGISPGIMVFMQNIAAIEVSVGILGFNTSTRKQITNQVYEGSRRTSGAKFGVDILSVKLGATIYLNSRKFKQR